MPWRSAEENNIVVRLFFIRRQWMHTAIYKRIIRDVEQIKMSGGLTFVALAGKIQS
jgi:hypothetical protein